MRLLTVPNWSFGRDKRLLRRFEEILGESGTRVHYLKSDLDHNRTVSAFSGEPGAVFRTVHLLANEALPCIDLTRHSGVHPRIGALDVCPFVPLEGYGPEETARLLRQVEAFGMELAERHQLPVFLYEKSEQGRHEADLPSLRKGGFGAIIERELVPDFGPNFAHPNNGVAVVGVRDFLIAMNVNLTPDRIEDARALASQIRRLRAEGDPRFLGVLALGLRLPTRNLVQVSLNLTLPGLTTPDSLIDWVEIEASKQEMAVAETELIGVIRMRDLPGAERLPMEPNQVVD